MKSFVAYPNDLETTLFPPSNEKKHSGRLVAHYELFKKVSHLDGCIVKCGISGNEGFERFLMLRNMSAKSVPHKMIAFEKPIPQLNTTLQDGETLVNWTISSSQALQKMLIKQGVEENIEFVPGAIAEAIQNYLITNPEFKIALLNIDLDDYEATLTTLEFLYPRLMPGGVLILDNFHKYLAEHKAAKTYFATSKLRINNFSVNNGPHFIIKP